MKRQFVYICTSPLRFFFSILGLNETPVFVSSSSNHLNKTVSKALDIKKEYLMIIFLISHQNHMLWPLI